MGMAKRILWSAILALMASAALAHEHIVFGRNGNQAVVVEPHDLAMNLQMEREFEELYPGVWGYDWGTEFATEGGHGMGEHVLHSMRLLQIEISPQMQGIRASDGALIFGDPSTGAPGYLDLTHDNSHVGMYFVSNVRPSRANPFIFRFQIVDAEAHDGTMLADSPIYTITFVPEPASMVALAAGLAIVARRRAYKARA